MKVGIRKPSVSKRIKARTTGKVKREIKSVNPLYGKKGMGLVNNPKKAVYNKVYNKTTVDSFKIVDNLKTVDDSKGKTTDDREKALRRWRTNSIIFKVLAIVCLVLFGLPGAFGGMPGLLIGAVVVAAILWWFGVSIRKKGLAMEAEESEK